ncbi:MAG: cellulase family glycosylhydrolase [Lachnospiraceae bacterium]|nr:cellulase family glycosylhydrolase [Lachnospiraceae bacterium]
MKVKSFFGKVLAGLLCAGLVLGNVGIVAEAAPVEGTGATQTVSAQMPFREMTADEMVAEMGTGWNLGNTMDGHTGFTPGETIWQNVETTQALIKTVHDAGFNTVRVPVTWGTMIDDSNNYAIDDKWMSRVQDIVDYCVNMNMYVIINVHHDGAEQSGWLRIGAEDLEAVKEKYSAVWQQIADRFKDYDEHVIFESMNEVVGPDNSIDGIIKDTQIIMELNQIFVNTVRATGSNNEVRWLSVPGRYTNITNMTREDVPFWIPDDTVDNRLFVAVHHYDWTFGLLENAEGNKWNHASFNNIIAMFEDLVEKFTSKGIPVILGEYGAINKNNTVDRTYHMEGMNRICQLSGVVPIYWDQGWYDLSMTPDFSFTLFDRATCEEIYPEIIEGILRGFYFEGKADLSDIVKEATVTPITDMGTYEAKVATAVGEVVDISLADYVDKSVSNDVIVWRSADETIATVNGDSSDLSVWAANVHGTGIGKTTITAYSHNGQAVLEIPVEVYAQETTKPCTDITLEQESVDVIVDQYFFLNAAKVPADSDAHLTYRSSNPEVATVSKIGKVVAKAKGTAYIMVSSSDGLTKMVKVNVSEGEAKAEIALALNVYFNDSEANYFSNEYGSDITISEDGTYKVEFDCSKDLSDNAKNAGVKGLNNLTAIYIKDHSVTKGLAKKSPLVSCNIIYDEVVVDGNSYKVNMDAPKAAMKASGIFDTNDPINSWDGSVIEEVTVSNHVLNFTDVENPQKVEVTFTISDLVFEEGATGVAAPEATEISAESSTLSINNTEDWVVNFKVSPANCGKVAFMSSDSSVVAVDTSAVVDGNGMASVKLSAMKSGNATITAITENGLTASMGISSSVVEVQPEAEETPAPTVEETPTPEPTKAPEPVAEPTELEQTASVSTSGTILMYVGIAVLGVVVFALTLFIAGGGLNKFKKK